MGRACIRRVIAGLALVATVVLVALRPGPAPAGAMQAPPPLHGADAVFAGHGVVIVWAVLRGADEAGTSVVLRIAARDAAVAAVAVDLIDPFGGQRVHALAPSAIGSGRDLRIARPRFAEHPRTELRFGRAPEALAGSAVNFVVYFTGVPDTTPEFAGEQALTEYLQSAVTRATDR
jgi:hypothetical protein